MSAASTSTDAATACWSCGAASGGAHFCPVCGKIQPLSHSGDYFAFFGLPPKLGLDQAELERRLHQLSWKLHPDNFVRASQYERDLSLERSSQLNDAYRALRDPVRRVEYLLAHAGVRKEGEQKQQAPPELLEEVFELNEWLDELRALRQAATGPLPDGAGGLAALREKLEAAQNNFAQKLDEVDSQLAEVFAEWDAAVDAASTPAGDEAARKKLMGRMNDILNRRSYIRNLVANVQKELAEA